MRINKTIQSLLSVLFLLIFASPIFASSEAGEDTLGSVIKVMIAVTAFLVAFVMWLVLVYSERGDNEGETFLAPIKKLTQLLTSSTPIEREKEILLDHDYDGIKELDNKIPPWFVALFYITIIFSVVYMIDYHIVGTGNIQEEEYLAEVKQAMTERKILAASGSIIDEESVTATVDAIALASGKEIFDKNCAACHGFGGEGLVGPNFTDDYWIHGGGIKNIFNIVKYGVPAKGMISWQSQLNPTEMQEVSSYILILKGTNPPNQKAAEGELWVDEVTDSTATQVK